jgi:UDP-galactopyranose mutase
MDELAAFAGAAPELASQEKALFERADVVFTGGISLYQSKRSQHRNVHLFPSSVDAAHFARARVGAGEPPDQAAIPHPKLGYCGVIDERMDLALLADIAAQRPHWNYVLLGPVTKIDAAALPQSDNLHYLGAKAYGDLPQYLAGWDVALLPFAKNRATRYISPTKIPEYLAAGKPVVSTSIADVVCAYGNTPLVSIADSAAAFIAATENAIRQSKDAAWFEKADAALARTSWDLTWAAMIEAIDAASSCDRRALG